MILLIALVIELNGAINYCPEKNAFVRSDIGVHWIHIIDSHINFLFNMRVFVVESAIN